LLHGLKNLFQAIAMNQEVSLSSFQWSNRITTHQWELLTRWSMVVQDQKKIIQHITRTNNIYWGCIMFTQNIMLTPTAMKLNWSKLAIILNHKTRSETSKSVWEAWDWQDWYQITSVMWDLGSDNLLTYQKDQFISVYN
jgi:hypothetical protein